MDLPPGFRFHPTDEELVMYYLCRKCAAQPITAEVIKEIDIYKHDPWNLPGMALYGEKEWYFFSPRDRKYPNGSRPNRAAGSGYWKATGADKPIGMPRPVAIKKALVFYAGKAPEGVKTNWIMHEYRLADVDRSARKNSLRLDDWVLCRIYKKKEGQEKQPSSLRKPTPSSQTKLSALCHVPLPKSHAQQQFPPTTTMLCFDATDSRPKLLVSDSTSSEQVLSSPELAVDVEVESQGRWEMASNDFIFNNSDTACAFEAVSLPLIHSELFAQKNDSAYAFSPLSPGFFDTMQDMLVFLEAA